MEIKKNKGIIAIIPARGSSKGVPKKNIKLLAGKPLIAYTIKEALKSKLLDRVIVSTDDEEIAEISRKYGAEVPFIRPSQLSKDDSSSLSVIIHCLQYLEKKEGYFPSIIVFLQPTSPFRKTEHIDTAIKMLIQDKKVDTIMGVSKAKQHPFHIFKRKRNGTFTPLLNIKNRPNRRQDLPSMYIPNASLYVIRRKHFDYAKEPQPIAPIFEGRVKAVVMDNISSIDINTKFDFLLAKKILEIIRKNGKKHYYKK
jgi:N-acylneuraminate cytidylyltransferase/CMP-N,N'-diacetyllegionaminic acid synthase